MSLACQGVQKLSRKLDNTVSDRSVPEGPIPCKRLHSRCKKGRLQLFPFPLINTWISFSKCLDQLKTLNSSLLRCFTTAACFPWSTWVSNNKYKCTSSVHRIHTVTQCIIQSPAHSAPCSVLTLFSYEYIFSSNNLSDSWAICLTCLPYHPFLFVPFRPPFSEGTRNCIITEKENLVTEVKEWLPATRRSCCREEWCRGEGTVPCCDFFFFYFLFPLTHSTWSSPNGVGLCTPLPPTFFYVIY